MSFIITICKNCNEDYMFNDLEFEYENVCQDCYLKGIRGVKNGV
jgi:formylmethanofuran dehydrogenase subunit E